MFKKKCEILFEDSSPSGRIICGLSNWDGLCLRIPKSRLAESLNIQGIKNTGVYFLVGEKLGEPSIYIGEAENIYDRLRQHLAKDTWQEAYIVTRKDNLLNKAHAKYLEHYFHEKAADAKRYEVLNKNMPTQSSISDFDVADMEEFIHYTIMLVGLLGCKAFDSIKDKHSAVNDLYIESVGLNAHAKMLDDEFVVLAGSQSRSTFKESSAESLRKKWKDLRDSNVIVDNTFTRDYSFPSPSAAAAVVLGRNASGLTEWKDKNKTSLKKLLEDK